MPNNKYYGHIIRDGILLNAPHCGLKLFHHKGHALAYSKHPLVRVVVMPVKEYHDLLRDTWAEPDLVAIKEAATDLINNAGYPMEDRDGRCVVVDAADFDRLAGLVKGEQP